MSSQTLRRAFLNYFKNHLHTIIPSSPVIPHDDPTLLFINAGMNQFKDVFLGKSKRAYTRAATTQKCIRVGGKHNDLDHVGHTSRHLTFFEMLGNFSFGDYFKKEAIYFAWDVTQTIFGFDPEKVWVSVYEDDDEAFALWEKHLPSKRIVRFGEKENFWAMGDTGPCGPCSELLFDRGDRYSSAKSPKEDPSGERYLEFWNLVFMQFSRNEKGAMEPLPKQSIDTGAGLERVVSLKMGVDNVFQTDILRELIAQVEEISKKKYSGEASFHVIADHIRSLSFAIADGVQPSNTDRGYILRKILRRAVRYGRMIGLQKPFLAQIFPKLLALMGDDFPELKVAQNRVEEILTLEEESFIRTLTRGGQLLSQVIDRSKQKQLISGEDAFKLKDTYGFPIEEVLLIANDENLKVDLTSYEKLEEVAKEKSRKAHKITEQNFGENFFNSFTKSHSPCIFSGHQKNSLEAHVLGIVVDGKFVGEIKEGQEGLILLDQTPFYAEMGGQVGDSGFIGKFQVSDCQTPFPGVIIHSGKMGSGLIRVKEKVQASIDRERRQEIQNNHTATHLLHWALQKVLGAHIKQAGSIVDEKRLRFDFSHHKSVTPENLREIENLVNQQIRTDKVVETYEMPYSEAQKKTDIKQFFGEKYGEKVRVVDIDFSKELCGGTHTSRVGTIGFFKLTKESSIGAGVRRIEAVTGLSAESWVQQEEDLLQTLALQLKSPVVSLPEKLQALVDENKRLVQELKVLRKAALKQLVAKYLSHQEKIGSISFIAEEVSMEAEEMGEFAADLLQQMTSAVVALAVKFGERCQFLVAVSADLEINAVELIKEIAPLIQGGGGGKQKLAQAGEKIRKESQKHLIRYGKPLLSDESILVEGLWDSPKALLASESAKKRSVLLITGGTREDRFYDNLAYFCPNVAVEFPAWETLPGEEIQPSPDIIGKRFEALDILIHKKSPSIVLCPLASLLQKVIPKEMLTPLLHRWRKGTKIPFNTLAEVLVSLDYKRVAVVSDKGEFAIRGGILDLFPVASSDPFRIEFFGDEIEEIRTFDPVGQKSIGKAVEVFLCPAKELPLLQKASRLVNIADYLDEPILFWDDLLAIEDTYVGIKSLPITKSHFFTPFEDLLKRWDQQQHIFCTEFHFEERFGDVWARI